MLLQFYQFYQSTINFAISSTNRPICNTTKQANRSILEARYWLCWFLASLTTITVMPIRFCCKKKGQPSNPLNKLVLTVTHFLRHTPSTQLDKTRWGCASVPESSSRRKRPIWTYVCYAAKLHTVPPPPSPITRPLKLADLFLWAHSITMSHDFDPPPSSWVNSFLLFAFTSLDC